MTSQVKNQFFIEMDGVKGSTGVLVVGATNLPEELDEVTFVPTLVEPPANKEKGTDSLLHGLFIFWVLVCLFDRRPNGAWLHVCTSLCQILKRGRD